MVVQWYLGCIRACQLEMTAARKPFNPVHGEIFKCICNMKDGSSFSLEFNSFIFNCFIFLSQ